MFILPIQNMVLQCIYDPFEMHLKVWNVMRYWAQFFQSAKCQGRE